MKLAVSKNNEYIDSYNFASEISGLESQEFNCFIGRDDGCLIQLNDHKISREHAQLSYSKGTWTIRKLSDVGVFFVNGVPCEQEVLKSGDVISIGDYSLAVFIEAVVKDDPPAEVVDDIIDEEPVESEDNSATEDNNQHDELESDSEEEVEFAEGGDDTVEDELNDDFGGENNSEESSNDFNDEYSDNEYSDNEYADNEYSDDEYADNDYSDNGGFDSDDDVGFDDDGSTKVFSGFTKVYLELFGEEIPFEKFELQNGEYLIGRDPEKCQIVLSDAEVSSVHAKIVKSSVNATLIDMKSANGILLNGARVDTAELNNGDEFIIGSVTFTYMVSSSFFQEASENLMPVEENQVVEVEEIIEVDEDDPEYGDLDFADDQEGAVSSSGGSLFSKEALQDPVKRKKLLYMVVGLIALWVFLDDGEPKKKVPKKAGDKKVKSHSLVKKEKNDPKKLKTKKKTILTPEQKEFVEATYQVAQERLAENNYQEAIIELDKIFAITPDYKQAKTVYEIAKNGLAKLEELEKKRQQEIEDKIRKAKVAKLVIKAREAVKKREVEVSRSLFNQILELDPENFDVPQLKIEIEAWQKEKERKELEEAQKKAERKRKLSQFTPLKTLFIQKKWNKAIISLTQFLKIKDMDEDLVKKATEMLEQAKKNLDNIVTPMLGRARSLQEGQDLKGAYEVYKKILEFDPGNKEALKQKNMIKDKLTLRARRVYRKALISESLSLFQEAKELYQEVLQISPSDSEYYIKASDKLKAFWEN